MKLLLLASVIIYLVVDLILAQVNTHGGAGTANEADSSYCVGAVSILGKVHRFIRCAEISSFKLAGVEAKMKALAETSDVLQLQTEPIDRALQAAQGIADDNVRKAIEDNLSQVLAGNLDRIGSVETKLDQLEQAKPRQREDSGQWLLVAGADRDKGQALHQVASIEKAIGEDPALLQRGSYLRTVIFYPDRAAAQRAASEHRAALKYGALIRQFSQFCPNAERLEPLDGVQQWRCGEP